MFTVDVKQQQHNNNTTTTTTDEGPGRVAQSVARLTQEPEILGSIPNPATYFRFSSPGSRRAVVSYWRYYVHEVIVKRLGGLSLPRKGVVMLTYHPDMTTAFYRRRKTIAKHRIISVRTLHRTPYFFTLVNN